MTVLWGLLVVALGLLAALAALVWWALHAAGVRELGARFGRLRYRDRLRVIVAVARDPRLPWRARAVPAALALYLLMPLDIVPDFIPVLGQLDDLLVAALAMWLLLRLTPRGLLDEHLARYERPREPASGAEL